MKVLHSTGWYYPTSQGGTEVYISDLVEQLAKKGVSGHIIRPDAQNPRHSSYGGVPVSTYRLGVVDDAEGRSKLETEFAHLLMEIKPDVYHQHAWTQGCDGMHLSVAKRMGLRTVLTMHTAAPVCPSGTKMYFGRHACAIAMDLLNCGQCWLSSRGANSLMSSAIYATDLLAERLGIPLSALVPGRLGSAFSARESVSRHLSSFKDMGDNADVIVVVCEWLRTAALINDVDPGKVLLCRQGISDSLAEAAKSSRPVPDGARSVCRLAYLGRLHPTKGIHIVIEALKRIPPGLSIELVIYGIDDGSQNKYSERIKDEACADPRIIVKPAISREDLADELSQFDYLVVPSLVMETGPLVVLEGQAFGLSILGARLGGIVELLRPGSGDRAISAGDVDEWSRVIRECALIAGKQVGDWEGVRRMSNVAEDMMQIYCNSGYIGGSEDASVARALDK